MKLALLSDIHANLHALDACLAHAAAQGIARLAVLGDLVDYGAHPAQVTRRVMALAAQGAAVVRGNHDQYAAAPPAAAATTLGQSGTAWTHAQLGEAERAFLAALPLVHRTGSLLLVHASADAPERWRYVDHPARAAQSLRAATRAPVGDAQVRGVLSGHVHAQALYVRGPLGLVRAVDFTPGVPVPLPPHRPWASTVGSVGQPRDGDPRAMYAVLDEAAQHITFHRVPYDVAAAAAAIRATPLPAFFAERLITGE